jgi:mono/diheme cytochrome c family protein
MQAATRLIMALRGPALVCLMAAAWPAHTAPFFPKGDAAKGQLLHQKNCASCHNSMMPDGKGEELYSEGFEPWSRPAPIAAARAGSRKKSSIQVDSSTIGSISSSDSTCQEAQSVCAG